MMMKHVAVFVVLVIQTTLYRLNA